MDKETKALRRRLRKLGYRTVVGGSGHIKVYDKGGRMVSSFSATASDHRAMNNILKYLRKVGIPI